MEEVIETFHIDWKLMIAQIINFGLVFAVFYFLAAKPLRKLMKDRTEEISTGLTDAEQARGFLQKATEEYNENTIKLRKLSIDAEAQLKKDLEKLKRDNLDRIKADTDEWVKKRTAQMEIDKKALIEGAKQEIIQLVIKTSEKLLGGAVDKAYEEKVVKELNSL